MTLCDSFAISKSKNQNNQLRKELWCINITKSSMLDHPELDPALNTLILSVNLF